MFIEDISTKQFGTIFYFIINYAQLWKEFT